MAGDDQVKPADAQLKVNMALGSWSFLKAQAGRSVGYISQAWESAVLPSELPSCHGWSCSSRGWGASANAG